MFYCTVCKKDFRSRNTLLIHKYKSKQHHENMKELVYSYKDTIGIGHIDTIKLLECHDIIASKIAERETTMHIIDHLFLRDENGVIINHGSSTFNDVVCFCDYCVEKKFDLCDYDYETMRDPDIFWSGTRIQ